MHIYTISIQNKFQYHIHKCEIFYPRPFCVTVDGSTVEEIKGLQTPYSWLHCFHPNNALDHRDYHDHKTIYN